MKFFIFILYTVVLFSCSNDTNNYGAKNVVPTGGNQTPLNPVKVTNANPGQGKITVLGDSLAAGYGTLDLSAQPLGCLNQIPNDVVFDAATSGFTSIQILNRWGLVKNLNSKLIFISSGGNDTMIDNNAPGTYPKQRTLDQLIQLFDETLQSGAVVVYLGLNPPVPYAARLPEVSAIAANKGVIVVDGMNGFWTDPNLMFDQIHPNTQGYKIICQRIQDAIKGYYP